MKDYTGPNTLLSAFKIIRQAIKNASPSAGDGLTKEGDTISVANPNRGILTQAEFDALPEEQKAIGTFFIDDGGGSGGGAGGGTAWEIYSTEETRIGTWVDGKPLYRKTIYSTIPDIVNDFTLVPGTGGLYIDQLVDAFGHVDTKDKSGQISIPNAYSLLKSTPGGINFMSESSNQVGTTIMFTIEYTKTTD